MKNYIIETDNLGRIISEKQFEIEEANTLFHSGLQLFIPQNLIASFDLPQFMDEYPEYLSLVQSVEDVLVRSFSI